MWPNVRFGEHCFVFEDNTVQPFVTLGDDVVLWSGNHIGHHTRIGSHNFFSSHVVISGSVVVGDRCFFGVNSTVRDNIVIEDENIIGAGALITKNTKRQDVYYGPRAQLADKKSSDITI